MEDERNSGSRNVDMDTYNTNQEELFRLIRSMGQKMEQMDSHFTNSTQQLQKMILNQMQKTPSPPKETSKVGFTTLLGGLKMASESKSTRKQNRRRQSVHRGLDFSSSSSSEESNLDSDTDSLDSHSDSSSDFSAARNSAKKQSISGKGNPNGSSNKRRLRTSILDNIASRQRNEVTIMQQQPRYEHIKLESISLRYIFKFMDEVYEYQNKNGVSLPVPALLSQRVREQIIAHHLKKLDITTFYQLSTEKILKYLLQEVKPRSKLAFIDCLEKHVHFDLPSNYKPNVSDFKPFYNALLLFRKEFQKVFDAISFRNEKNIPDLKNKEGGLIKVFLDKIKFEYGKRLFKSFDKEKFRSLEDFLKTFYEAVENDFKRHKSAKETNSHFGGTELLSATKSTYSKPLLRDKTFTAPKRYGKLHHIAQDLAISDSEIEDSNLALAQIDRTSHDEHLDGSEQEFNEPQPQPKTEDHLSDASNAEDDHLSQQIQELSFVPTQSKLQLAKDKTDTNTVPNGCYQMVLFGSCPKEKLGAKCTYSHEPHVLMKTHGYISKLLANSKFKPASVFRKPPASVNEISAISELYNSSNTSPHLPIMIQNMFLNAMPEVSMFSVIHRQGQINLPDKTIPIDKALFDTGALHGSYISRKFISLHQDELQHMLQPCHGVIKLADSKTTASIDHVIDLPVLFVGDDYREHCGIVRFYVFETMDNDVIIGLPAIVKYFSPLLKQMIDNAVDMEVNPSLSSQAVDAISSAPQYPWTHSIEEDAPEDIATDLPSSFPYALHYMEMTSEEALKEYLALIPSHVDEAFRQSTKIVQLLESKGAKVFVPQNWDGIKGFEPLQLKWREGMPSLMKPRARPINPKLYQHAHKEFQRLLKYFYIPSDSPIASCLVIAPKATSPFIRFCGDYVAINKFIITGHYPIPYVQLSLEKITSFKIFLDFDMVNSFHQIKLAQETSEKLSVQTPWGQVRPLFLPEGVPPASGVLQSIVSDIFGDFSDWSIAIFDNLLVLAHDYDDAYRKVEIILDRCIERNVFLKFSKSWLGFDHANFFGYICRYGRYELAQARKDAINAVAFPSNMKQMQSFLGAALFFKSFIPHYSSLVSPLNDMIKKDFNWDNSTWKEDYHAAFNRVKSALQDATAIFYPDYHLDWILRTDASQHGVGAVLLQLAGPLTNDTEPQYQPIGFVSQKFSPQASRWTTIEQEAYGIYFGVKSFAYYLLCKPFILETDHNNLLWMEASAVPKVIRWRVYLQSFSFLLRHIPGKHNLVADWLSRAPTIADTSLSSIDHLLFQLSGRVFSLVPDSSNSSQEPATSQQHAPPTHNNPSDIISLVHGGRMGHFGTRKTWKMLNEFFPGHKIPYRVVDDFVSSCAVCQKDRLGMVDNIQPITLTLKPEHRRSMVGVDTLTITPPDEAGNEYLTVIVNHFTKLTGLYPSKLHDALSSATALFQYFCTYGLIDSIISDPGSEFMNEVVNHLTRWFGIRHRFSLVDRHESNGVEHTNQMILRHLKALVFDERVQHRWSDPTVLPLIQFLINSFDSSETGVIPFHAHFGSSDAIYFNLPAIREGEEENSTLVTQQYIKLLDENLKLLHNLSKKHQETIAAERVKNSSSEFQNIYQPGDFVLWQRDLSQPLPTKLSPRFVGPYEVIAQARNDVTCRHVILGHIKVFHVSRLKIFHGTYEQAKQIGMVDNNQFVIHEFKSYRGDPLVRTSMEFEILFEDQSLVWLPWSKDLFDTAQYETFCRSRPELYPLIFDVKTAKLRIREINKLPISEIKPGDEVLVDLRCYGHGWYQTLQLEDKDHLTYLVEYRYIRWKSSKHLKIEVICLLFNEVFVVDHYFVKSYGSWTEADWIEHSIAIRLVDEDLIRRYPAILPNSKSM